MLARATRFSRNTHYFSMQHTYEELFGSDSDEAEAATPAVAQSPTASDARVDEILRYGARAACTAALGCSPTASEFELYENDPDGFEEELMDEDDEEEDEEEEGEEEEEEEEEEDVVGEDDEEEGSEQEEDGNDDSEQETYLLEQLPSKHLESVGAHVAKANACGFFASDSTIVPVQLPVKVSDGSFNYLVIAGRLHPKPESGRSRSVVEPAELCMGQSMADAAGMRCRLVANCLVHATTAASRVDLQNTFGTHPFTGWLSILYHPDLPALVLEPVHTLQNIAPATKAEIKQYSARPDDPKDEEGHPVSQGTLWLRSLAEGAQAGSMDGVARLLSMTEVQKAAKAAEKQAAAAKRVTERAAINAAKAAAKKEKAERASEREAKAAKDAQLRPPPKPPPPKPPPKPPPPPPPPPPRPTWPRNGLPVGAVCSLRPAPGSSNFVNRKVTVAVVHSPTSYKVRERSGREHVVGSERLELLSLPAPGAYSEEHDDRGNDRGDDRRDDDRERTPAPRPKGKARRSRDRGDSSGDRRDSSSSSSSSSSSREESPLSAHQRRRILDEREAAELARMRADVERDERKRENRRHKKKRKRKRQEKRQKQGRSRGE